MTAVDRITAIVGEHRVHDSLDCYRCACGASTPKGPDARGWRERHLAERIAAADDLAVLELPKAEPDSDRPTFDAGCGAITHAEPDGDVRLHSVSWIGGRFGGVYRSPDTAIQLAAALLAAAKAARRVAGSEK